MFRLLSPDDSKRDWLRPFALVVVITTLVTHAVRCWPLGFLGWDAYPLLAASMVDGTRDWIGLFSRPLADGLIGPNLYRPLMSLLIAAEIRLFGSSEASPFLLMNLALFALLVGLVSSWVRTLGEGSGVVATWAVLFVGLHPVALDIVPFLARRADVLLAVFLVACLLCDQLGRQRRSRWLMLLALLFAAGAVASKESAVVLPLLAAAQRWCFSSTGRPWTESSRGLVLYSAVVTAMVQCRWWVLGSLERLPPFDSISWPKAWAASMGRILIVGPTISWVAVSLLATGFLMMVANREGRQQFRSSRSLPVPMVAFGATWTLTFSLLFSLAGRLAPWYLLVVVIGSSLAFGSVLREATKRLAGDPKDRRSAVVTLAGAGLLLLAFSLESLGPSRWRDLAVADARGRQFLSTLSTKVEGAAPGDIIDIGATPKAFRGIAILSPTSIRGWLAFYGLERVSVVVDEQPSSFDDSRIYLVTR